MYQYFRPLSNPLSDISFASLSLKEIRRYFILNFFLLFVIVYLISFLAVEIPFLTPHAPLVYLLGGIYFLFFLGRLAVQIRYYYIYGEMTFHFSGDGIHVLGDKKSDTFSRLHDLYLVRNPFGFLKIVSLKEGIGFAFFPLFLLSKDDQTALLSLFRDMTPVRTGYVRMIRDTCEAILIALVLAVHIIVYVAQNYFIPTSSMRNTLIEGDHLFAEKISYGLHIPPVFGMKNELYLDVLQIRPVKRGDVVIFDPPTKSDTSIEYIKRVIAVEGEHFALKDGYVYINGKRLKEDYVIGKTYYLGDNTQELEAVVPAGFVVVLGDNRNDSQDSRIFGYVPVKNIHARAFFLYFNLGDFRKFDFSRFGFIH